MVLIGNGGAEMGMRGYVTAYDAETGKQIWRFYTVPGDPSKPFESPALEKAAKTWSGEWWKLGGGGPVWDSIVYDPELDLIYIGVGNGTPWNRAKVRGDALYLSSIVAVKADTGEYVWHYQTTPGDEWDYDACSPLILADLTIGGAQRGVIMQAPKNGFFYVLDRATGELLSADPYAVTNWAKSVDLKTGRPVVESARALRRERQALRRHARTRRRTQLAAHVIQSADATGLHSGHRTELPVHPGEERHAAPAGLEYRGRFQCRKPAAGPEDQGADQERPQGASRGLGSGGAQRSVARRAGASLERRRGVDRGQSGVSGQRHGRVRRLPRR